jgi:hypothetical protein
MMGLGGARVVVVDDDEQEALPVLKAFAKNGIATAFFDGRKRGLPRKDSRLKGVRLAILDMDIVGGGVSDNSKASALVKLVDQILSPENGPYAVLAWTKHPELIDIFERYVFQQTGMPKPIFTVSVEKAECRSAAGAFDLGCISEKIEAALKQISPLMLLQGWEGECFTAATDVINTLSDLAAEANSATEPSEWRNHWRDALLQILYAMAKAHAEKHLDEGSCLAAIYAVLNPLHADRMDSNAATLYGTLKDQAPQILAASADCGAARKAKVNASLHLSFEHLKSFSPGNVYKLSTRRKPKGMPGREELIELFMKSTGDATRNEEIKAEISAVATPIAIEVNPVCDHAQKNVHVARFIAGLVIPASIRTFMKTASGFIWEFGPFVTTVFGSGHHYFYLSSRDLITNDLKHAVKLTAIARIRGQCFADLQVWLAGQSARPGVLLLR